MKKILIFFVIFYSVLAFPKPKTIVFYGTSLTSTGAWTDSLMAYVKIIFPGVRYYNVSKGDMNSIWGAQNLNNWVISRNPDIVTMEFAINDSYAHPNQYYENTTVSLDLSRQNAVNMIDTLRKYYPNVKIYILSMNMPLDSLVDGRNPAQDRPEWKTYYQLWKDLALEKGVGFIDITSEWQKLDYETLWSYIPDGLHPNKLGNSNVTVPTMLPVIEGAFWEINNLGIDLSSFSAKEAEGLIQLSWNSAEEIDDSKFEIQRSSDGKNFIEVGKIQGHGSKEKSKQYFYFDKPQNAGVYYFRLKKTDCNGFYKYSDAVQIPFVLPTSFSLKPNYPNPFNPTTVISYDLPLDNKVEIKIFDAIGNEIETLVNEVEIAGTHTIVFDAQNKAHKQLSSGIYFCMLKAGNHSEVKKMMLLK